MTARILVCDPLHPDGVAMLRKAGFEVVENFTLSPDELVKRIPEFDAVVVRGRTKITAEVINAGAKLRAVARSGVGLDNIDQETARRKSIQVISTPAAPTTSVAELAIGLMLSVLRKIAYADRAMKDGRWVKAELMGNELRGKTIGVVGAAGRIGIEVARIAVQGFGALVIGYDVIDFTERARQLGIRVATQLPDLLRESDIVTVHVPYLKATHHLIDEKALDSMKKGSILINTSRGDIVDGEALLRLLKSGKLSAAGLDVFHKEPPVDEWEKELTQLPTVVCTTHIGAQTAECQRLESTLVAEQLVQALRSK
jgi:D-3-phosphoglycerate dehydrogenase